MMNRRRIAPFASLTLLVTAISGCLGGGAYDRPDEARAVVGDFRLRDIEDAGMVIHGGQSPPDITGTYRVEPDAELIYADNANAEIASECVERHTYEAHSSGSRLEFSWIQTGDDCDEVAEGVAFLSGSGDCFTTYSHDSSYDEGCYLDRVFINSACVDGTGNLADAMTAVHTQRAEGVPCQDRIAAGELDEAGQLRVGIRDAPIELIDE